MIKNILFGVILVNILIGCGGGDDSSSSSSPKEEMSKKEGVFIFFNYPEKSCESKSLYRKMQVIDGVKNLLIQVASNNVSCAVYNKNQNNCKLIDGGFKSSLSCVIGYDKDDTDNINNKLSYDNKPALIEDITEVMILSE